MKKIFTSELLPKSSFLYSCREKKHSKNIYLIVFLIFVFTSLLPAQSTSIKDALDTYKKNFYLWKEPEAKQPANDSILTVLGRWAWGPCLAVDADSNFAYIGNGPTFQVLDISNPFSPKIVGEYLTEGFIYDLEVRDNTAFVCIGSGLLILDITDPTAPDKISFVEISGVAISFALEDSFAYVTTFSGYMQVVDISDLNNPYKRGAIAAGGERAFCVEAKDGYVYIGNPESPPMVIVDATNPDTLTRVDFEVGGWGYSAYIKDTLLFIGVHGYSGTNYFKIYNVSDAATPQFLGEANFIPPEDIMTITVSKDKQTAFARTTIGNIYSIDITDLTQPEAIYEYERPIAPAMGNTGIVFINNSVISAHYNGLLTLGVLQPDTLFLLSFFPTGGTALEMDSKDSLVFVACGLSGLWTLNISNPSEPQKISNVLTGGFTADVVVDGTLAYIVNWASYSEQDTSRGLWIIDFSDVYNPTVLSHYIGITNFSTTTESNSIYKSANLVFITQQPRTGVDSILEIIDVSDAYQPKRLGVFISDYYPKSTTTKDTILFLATRNAGLRILNIKNPNQPVEINVFSDSSNISISDVYDDLLYADKSDTLFVLNISNPEEPFILGRLEKTLAGTSRNIEPTENYVYLKDGVIDVTDPNHPKELASSPDFEYSYDIEAISNLILLSNIFGSGIIIFKNDQISSVTTNYLIPPENFQLLQNYPNPFNPSTTIKFEIPKDGFVKLKIYNILGEEIETLVNEERLSGRYEVNFDASKLASGVFIYRLSVNDLSAGSGQSFVNVKKMIFIK